MSPLFIYTLLLLLIGACFRANAAAAAANHSAASANYSRLTTAAGLHIHNVSTDTALALIVGSELSVQGHQPDNQTIAAFSEAGACFAYLNRMFTEYNTDGWNRDKELAPCKAFCQKGNPDSGYGCIAPNVTSLSDLDPSIIFEDDDGLHWTPGSCDCDFEIAEILIDIIAEGLSKLDMVFCSLFMSIFEAALDVGTMFMPGADILDAMELLVVGAKTVDENALGPLDYFHNWLNKQCGLSGMGVDPISMFAMLLGASDALGTSKGCSRKNPAGCAKPKEHPDAPKDVARSDPKDPWEGETPPKDDIPVTCDNTRLGRLQSRGKCKKIPSLEKEGYTYQDLGGTGFYPAGSWSIKCPGKWDSSKLDDVAVLNIDKNNGILTVDYAYLDMVDSIKKLKLRDMMAGTWASKGTGGVETINKVVHQTVVEKGWKGKDLGDRGIRGQVQDLLGKSDYDAYSVRVDQTGKEKQAFDLILKKTTQGAGVFKMLEEYAGGAGRQVYQIDVTRGGGQDDIHFWIGKGNKP